MYKITLKISILAMVLISCGAEENGTKPNATKPAASSNVTAALPSLTPVCASISNALALADGVKVDPNAANEVNAQLALAEPDAQKLEASLKALIAKEALSNIGGPEQIAQLAETMATIDPNNSGIGAAMVEDVAQAKADIQFGLTDGCQKRIEQVLNKSLNFVADDIVTSAQTLNNPDNKEQVLSQLKDLADQNDMELKKNILFYTTIGLTAAIASAGLIGAVHARVTEVKTLKYVQEFNTAKTFEAKTSALSEWIGREANPVLVKKITLFAAVMPREGVSVIPEDIHVIKEAQAIGRPGAIIGKTILAVVVVAALAAIVGNVMESNP